MVGRFGKDAADSSPVTSDDVDMDGFSRFIAQLDPHEFLRVHRSHMVRVAFMVELHPMFHGDYELVLRDGQRLALSRRYKKLLPEEFRARL